MDIPNTAVSGTGANTVSNLSALIGLGRSNP